MQKVEQFPHFEFEDPEAVKVKRLCILIKYLLIITVGYGCMIHRFTNTYFTRIIMLHIMYEEHNARD